MLTTEMFVYRQETKGKTTFGEWYRSPQEFQCYTLEDVIREQVEIPVSDWKIPGETAIPAGRYKVTMAYSGRFGANTITLHNVPGFSSIRVHGGNSPYDTEGCIIVGDRIDEEQGLISGAAARGVLQELKDVISRALTTGEVWLTITNPIERKPI